MQSPASSIQSPRPPGRSSGPPQVPFDKELMASLHVLLNQLGEVERQGLVMFHKIEESFKHPYTQQEAIADTANLLIQLDALSSQAKTTGFGALTILPTSPTVASTPSASASAAAGTPKPMFMSPRMQNHIHNNFNIIQNNNNTTTAHNSIMDTQMQSPSTSLSLVSTPAASGSGSTPATTATSAVAAAAVVATPSTLPLTTTTPGAPTPVTNPGSATATPAATAVAATIGNGGVQGAASPFSSSDVLMTSTSTPVASGPGSNSVADPSSSTSLSTSNNSNNNNNSNTSGTAAAMVATPATPSANSSSGGVEPGVALAQMMDARNRDVQALYTEKRKLKSSLQIAAKMSRT